MIDMTAMFYKFTGNGAIISAILPKKSTLKYVVVIFMELILG